MLKKALPDNFSILEISEKEKFLRKIHFNRRKSISEIEKKFLLEEYRKTKDIRFFNELLWVEENGNFSDEGKALFKTNLSPGGYHQLPELVNLKTEITEGEFQKEIEMQDLKKKKICLIGNPIHFLVAGCLLKKNNVPFDVINIIGGRKKDKLQLLTENPVARRIFRIWFSKNNYNEIFVSKEEIKAVSLPQEYDLGFHKLSFIIPESLFKCFRIGLINDHWGGLPFFKGRSTIDYSILLGKRPVITNHLISNNIDAGEIVSFWKMKGISRKDLKKEIYFGLGRRILMSLSLLASRGTKRHIDNRKGFVFYEMHPWLKEYTDKLEIPHENEF